jgi:lycopene cyclase domain-containing protein
VRSLTYLGILVLCLAAAAWVEPVLRVGVFRRWRRLAAAVLPVAAVFVGWDAAAIAAGDWSYDPAQLVGVSLPGGVPLEELLFFLVVPVCVVLGFEAVRKVTGWPAGDESEPS